MRPLCPLLIDTGPHSQLSVTELAHDVSSESRMEPQCRLSFVSRYRDRVKGHILDLASHSRFGLLTIQDLS